MRLKRRSPATFRARTSTLSRCSIDGTTSRVVLTGTAPSQDDVARATQIAIQFAGSDTNVANIINVSGTQQVKLKVTVAEVGRDTVKQLGINLDGSISIGAVNLGFVNNPANGGASGVTNTNGITAGIAAGPFNLDASLRALERRGALAYPGRADADRHLRPGSLSSSRAASSRCRPISRTA